MIVDLVRNDLGRVCECGSVDVPSLLAVEAHPGLCHLVSTVEGRLRAGCGWAERHRRHVPAGLGHRRAEAGRPRPHRPARAGRRGASTAARSAGSTPTAGAGELNVAIRTFWFDDGALHFGTGGGITWDSTPAGEWDETELKARRLLRVASSQPARRDAEHRPRWLTSPCVLDRRRAACRATRRACRRSTTG